MYPPKRYTAYQLGLDFDNLFGALGPETHVTGHYTAGPVDESDAHAIRLCKAYHSSHKGQGWGGIGYHFCITRKGNIICLRPLVLKGAHVGGWNSNNVGVMMHGATGDRPTRAQARSYRWLIANAHTRKMPRRHRADRDLRNAKRHGHNSWPGHTSNGCPGSFKRLFVTGAR